MSPWAFKVKPSPDTEPNPDDLEEITAKIVALQIAVAGGSTTFSSLANNKGAVVVLYSKLIGSFEGNTGDGPSYSLLALLRHWVSMAAVPGPLNNCMGRLRVQVDNVARNVGDIVTNIPTAVDGIAQSIADTLFADGLFNSSVPVYASATGGTSDVWSTLTWTHGDPMYLEVMLYVGNTSGVDQVMTATVTDILVSGIIFTDIANEIVQV
jgi:hypothetical protein